MPTQTTNYGLTKDNPEEFYNVLRVNNNLDIIDATLKENAEAIVSISNSFASSNTFQEATVVGSQIQLSQGSDSGVLKFKLNQSITGNVSLSFDGGLTSKPVVDFDGIQLTELEKGFVEVVADATFFTLRNRGGGLSSATASSVRNKINTLILM